MTTRRRSTLRRILVSCRDAGHATACDANRPEGAVKPGTVTVSGKAGAEVPPSTLDSVLKQASLNQARSGWERA